MHPTARDRHPLHEMRTLHRKARRVAAWGLLLGVLSLQAPAGAAAAGPNGFDLTRHDVPPAKILRGGPPRDAIPALTNPRFTGPARAGLAPADRVIGLVVGDTARAYPVRSLNWHELVNDVVGGIPVAITYCPLCASGAAFDRRSGSEALTFGVSGLLYNSNMLLFDRQSESLWSQMAMRAVAGPRTGARLRSLPVYHGTWAAWRARHPETEVLSFETGHARDYTRDPYAGYETSSRLYFPIDHESELLPRKTLVFGVAHAGVTRAYPLPALALRKEAIADRFGTEVVRIHYDAHSGSARAIAADGKEIPAMIAYWFAWHAFHPGSTVWQPGP